MNGLEVLLELERQMRKHSWSDVMHYFYIHLICFHLGVNSFHARPNSLLIPTFYTLYKFTLYHFLVK